MSFRVRDPASGRFRRSLRPRRPESARNPDKETVLGDVPLGEVVKLPQAEGLWRVVATGGGRVLLRLQAATKSLPVGSLHVRSPLDKVRRAPPPLLPQPTIVAPPIIKPVAPVAAAPLSPVVPAPEKRRRKRAKRPEEGEGEWSNPEAEEANRNVIEGLLGKGFL